MNKFLSSENQIKGTESAQLPPTVIAAAKQLGEEIIERYKNLPTVDMEKFNSTIHIMDACTGYEYLKGLVSASESKIDTRISDYIDSHVKSDLSVSKLCSVFHLSHSEIYSILKNYFDMTPADYVRTRRLNKACNYLKETDLQVNKITILCGLPDYNYFSKTFKRFIGVSPREYRKGEN